MINSVMDGFNASRVGHPERRSKPRLLNGVGRSQSPHLKVLPAHRGGGFQHHGPERDFEEGRLAGTQEPAQDSTFNFSTGVRGSKVEGVQPGPTPTVPQAVLGVH